jgi:hypothetical protein
MAFRRVIREPLLHFFLLGAALFLLFGWLNRGAMEAPDEVVVDQARIESLVAQFQRVWQRSPTPAEAQGLIDNWIREEIMYREGAGVFRPGPARRRSGRAPDEAAVDARG